MSIKDKYKVQSIKTGECKEWFLKKHYAKSVPLIEYAFGLFDKNNILQGVCSYGQPCRKIGQFVDLELNRLVVNENLPRNALSFFVSQTLKQLPKNLLIVSYSDIKHGHHGYIYQATNWAYTGKTEKDGHPDIYIDGKLKHPRSLYSIHGTSSIPELNKIYGNRMNIKEKLPKHRYFYFTGKKMDIKYPILPYPKGENKRYDASYKPQVQVLLF